MRQLTALLWKEHREHRFPFALGCAFFMGFYLLLVWLAHMRPPSHGPDSFSSLGEVLVLLFGAGFGVLIAVGATCGDLMAKKCVFWQSRPIPLERLMLAKYATGLLVLLVVTCGALILQFFVRGWALDRAPGDAAAFVFIYHTPVLVFVYSVAFFLGCLVRRATEAAMLSAIAAALVYFAPLVVPPLARFGVINLMTEAETDALPVPEYHS